MEITDAISQRDDLNRQYLEPNPEEHSPAFALKSITKAYSTEGKLAFFCDFHGHSRKNEVFMYGCVDKRSLSLRPPPLLVTPEARKAGKHTGGHRVLGTEATHGRQAWVQEAVTVAADKAATPSSLRSPGLAAMAMRSRSRAAKLARERIEQETRDESESISWLKRAHAMVFPLLLARECGMFSFEESRFTVHKSKAGTGRVVVRRECDLPTAYTLEASFSAFTLKAQNFLNDSEQSRVEEIDAMFPDGESAKQSKGVLVHFKPSDWIELGLAFGRALQQYWDWYRPYDTAGTSPIYPLLEHHSSVPFSSTKFSVNNAKQETSSNTLWRQNIVAHSTNIQKAEFDAWERRKFEAELLLRWQRLPCRASNPDYESDSAGDGHEDDEKEKTIESKVGTGGRPARKTGSSGKPKSQTKHRNKQNQNATSLERSRRRGKQFLLVVADRQRGVKRVKKSAKKEKSGEFGTPEKKNFSA